MSTWVYGRLKMLKFLMWGEMLRYRQLWSERFWEGVTERMVSEDWYPC